VPETVLKEQSENQNPGTKINKVTFKGFKSFKTKTAIPFFEGLTAIVGSNGSGKSNLIDGITFVFGRRSSKLRAEKLEQLIFNGGENQEPADEAKVDIYLDNSSGMFDEFTEQQSDELKISRKITRAGSSIYKLQGSNVKKSVIDRVASKAGIDPSGYHFVKQGKVTEIVEQSNKQRRQIVDEISGVRKYDDSRESAVQDLEEVEEKLKQEQVKIDEKQKQVERLEEQKELALKYKKLEERKKKLEASLLEVRKRAISKRLADINSKFDSRTEKSESLEQEVDEIDNKIDNLQSELDDIRSTGPEKDLDHIQNRIEKKQSEIQSKKQRISDLEDQIKELEQMKRSSQSNRGSRSVNALMDLENDDIYGMFGDLISYDPRYQVAMETAASGHMTDLVVKDGRTATEAIEYLKKNSIGRARMLPLEKLDERGKSGKSRMAKKRDNVIDYASNLVDSKYQKAVNYVFSDTLIAENLEAVQDVDGVRVVTLDGDKMSRGGAMTGGKKKSKNRSGKSSSTKNIDTESKKEKIEDLKSDISELSKDKEELQKMKRERKQEQDSEEDETTRIEQIQEQLENLRDRRKEKYSELQKLRAKMEDVDSKKARLKNELEDVKQKLGEFDYSDEELIGLDSDPENLEKRKQKVVKKQSSMGHVNMMAIEEYEELQQELQDQKEAVSDIRKEKLEVEEMIQDIDAKRRQCFMNALNELQSSFSRIFKDLFGGGKAELVLEDNDIDKGLKIRAAPPNKDPHVIEALSGGEKTMTAIAFVFSILEYEKSPFYIMDEIDAALDKENSKKLGELLLDYAENNQFIVVSHDEITVRHAERAYGVSMRSGISHIRSIELDS
jgi:chromosome segregation protein